MLSSLLMVFAICFAVILVGNRAAIAINIIDTDTTYSSDITLNTPGDYSYNNGVTVTVDPGVTVTFDNGSYAPDGNVSIVGTLNLGANSHIVLIDYDNFNAIYGANVGTTINMADNSSISMTGSNVGNDSGFSLGAVQKKTLQLQKKMVW
jgi:hypothetical protein